MVESTRLESERTGNRTVGSNPTLSARHGDTQAEDGDSSPRVLANAFVEENFCSKGPGGIAQSKDRHLKITLLVWPLPLADE